MLLPFQDHTPRSMGREWQPDRRNGESHAMHAAEIQDTRIQLLNDLAIVQGHYVLYWMQQSQRADRNQALELAVREANRLKQGVLVAFGLMDDYPEANMRHYTFMLEGLRETEQA